MEKELARLCEYAFRVHKSGKVCIFIDFSGHVGWMSVSVRKSIKEYATELYNRTIAIIDYDGKNIPVKTIQKNVDETIADIESTLTNLQACLKSAKEIERQKELNLLAELKTKYEPVKD
jgi:hypothetical protein